MKKAIQYYMPHFKIVLYIVVFIVCFGLALLLFSIGTRNKITLPVGNMQNYQAGTVNTATWMKMSKVGTMSSYSVGQDIELIVHADSDINPIAGYDLLFLYDPASLSVVKVSSADETFDVFTFNNSNYASVTGTKKLSINSQSPLTNSKLLSITVRAKKAGMTSVSIAPKLGPERTKMVDNQAQIIVPQLELPTQLNIQ